MCTWILICANFVPISLLVTLEMVKVFQANFIESDEYLIDDEHKILTHVQSSNLNEELGQVNYGEEVQTLMCREIDDSYQGSII